MNEIKIIVIVYFKKKWNSDSYHAIFISEKHEVLRNPRLHILMTKSIQNLVLKPENVIKNYVEYEIKATISFGSEYLK